MAKTIAFWVALLVTAVLLYSVFAGNRNSGKETDLTFTQFMDQVKEKNVKDVKITVMPDGAGADITGSDLKGAAFKTIIPSDYPAVYDQLQAAGANVKIEHPNQSPWLGALISWAPFLFIIGFWIFFMRQMQSGGNKALSFGKSRARLLTAHQKKVTFKDVAGVEEAKEELQEIIDFIKEPQKFQKLGGRLPKGVLLVGPTGTGKTLLARAIAGEANVPFFSLSGSDFVEMFVGVGASRVRDLFKQAKEKAPSIIFIDEIDAIGRARGRSVSMGANDERENTLNQLLTEMDGFGTNSGVILIGATNRADVLDRALMRPGRFDRQIFVDMPDLNEREAILKVHLKPLKLDITVDVSFLARQTPGFSGADLANICNEAALIAARKKKKQVDKQDFLDAVDRVVGGLEKKNKIITPEEKRHIAFH